MQVSIGLFLMIVMVATVNAFSTIVRQPRSRLATISWKQKTPNHLVLYAQEGEEEAPPSTEEEEVPPSPEEEASTEGDEEEEEEAPPPEDSEEVKELKNQISKLEQQMSGRRETLNNILDMGEFYSKNGYVRRVAQMETLRRSQASLTTSSEGAAMGGVMKEFIPLLERLDEQSSQYGGDEFGANFSGLTSAFASCLMGMGMQAIVPAVGEAVNKHRMEVLEELHSDEQPADTVLECVKPGYEVGASVLRPAVCIVSLGKEEEETTTPNEETTTPEEEGATAAAEVGVE